MIIQSIPWRDPVSTFRQLSRQNSFSVLLDSSLNNCLGRYSIIGVNPFCILQSKNNLTKVISRGKTTASNHSVFDTLRKLLNQYRIKNQSPLPFLGGAIGYFGYELLTHLEKTKLPNKDDLMLPDAVFGFFDAGIIFDHWQKKVFIFSTGLPERTQKKASQNLNSLISLLKSSAKSQLHCHPCVSRDPEFPWNWIPPIKIGGMTKDTIKSNFTKDEYLQAVLKAKRYIKEGDIYQVNLAQRFETELSVNPWELYRRLRAMSPSPFGGMLNFGAVKILSASPERFLRLNKGIVETRPMKGTRPRGENKIEDAKLKAELLNSGKDSAELLMITDLLRNDLGKVCEYGSIRVKRLKNLEKYKTVFQTTALIEGKLHPSKDRVDLIKACFPGGSVTGAPKVRSTRIISQLEPHNRGPYTGALGYLSFCGNMDLNIIIRSIIINGKIAYFHAGGGIVADSEPEKEYQETFHKAKALIEALQ